MFPTPGLFEEFLVLRNWRYKRYYTILTKPGRQCVVKTGRNYQIFSGSRSGKNEGQAHSIIVVSLSITSIYLYRVLCMLQTNMSF